MLQNVRKTLGSLGRLRIVLSERNIMRKTVATKTCRLSSPVEDGHGNVIKAACFGIRNYH